MTFIEIVLGVLVGKLIYDQVNARVHWLHQARVRQQVKLAEKMGEVLHDNHHSEEPK